MSPRLILGLFKVVTWPHWREHVSRTLLTVVGVSLGVTTVVAIADVSESVLASFGDMVDTVAGDAEIEVSADVGELPERVLEIVRAVDGVGQAEGVVERFLTLESGQGGSLFLLGADFLGASVWRRQLPRASIDIEDELDFLSNLDSVAIPVVLAGRMGLALEDEIQVMGPAGVRSLTVRGLIGEAPVARLFDGTMGIMDLPAAQRLLGIEGRLDRVAVRLAPGAQLGEVARRLAAAVGPGVQVGTPDARSERVARLMFSLRTTLAIMSLGAVIVGAFIVYHTVAISILQRRREFALLNACGVGRRALVGLCGLETLSLALPGVLLGLLTGKITARLAASLVGATVSEIWAHVDVTTFAWSAWGTAIAVAVGLGTALVSATVAIRQTFQAPTVEALRPVGLASGEPGSVLRPLVVGAVLVGCVWLIAFAPRQLGFASTVTAIIGTQVLGYGGLALLAAPAVWLIGVSARAVLGGASALPTRLAADNLPRSPGRSAGIVATIGATMAIAVTVATLIASHDVMSLGWIEQHFGGDLFVGGGDRVRLMPSIAMQAEIADRIAALPMVESVERFRMIPITVEGHPAFLQGVDLDIRPRRGGLPMVEGTLEEAADALAEGRGVLLSENLAYRLDRRVGDVVRIPTPTGEDEIEVVGTYVDYLGSLDHGAVVVDDRLLRERWRDDRANLLRVWLRPGVSTAAGRGALLEALGASGGYFVLTARAFVDGIRAVIDRFFAATWALEVVAALVGVIGVINTQLANVLDRASEIRVMRIIGVPRRDVIRSVVMECGVLGGIGGLLGAGLGLIFGSQIVLVSLRLVTGWRMPFVIPTTHLVATVLIAAVVSALAGLLPARRAADLAVGQRSFD